jgi:hypothetical protein
VTCDAVWDCARRNYVTVSPLLSRSSSNSLSAVKRKTWPCSGLDMTFEILTAASIKWPSSGLLRHVVWWKFTDSRPEDRGSRHLWSVGKLIPYYTAQQASRRPSSCRLVLATVGCYRILSMHLSTLYAVLFLPVQRMPVHCSESSAHNLFLIFFIHMFLSTSLYTTFVIVAVDRSRAPRSLQNRTTLQHEQRSAG